jgi:hypothetical protein
MIGILPFKLEKNLGCKKTCIPFFNNANHDSIHPPCGTTKQTYPQHKILQVDANKNESLGANFNL